MTNLPKGKKKPSAQRYVGASKKALASLEKKHTRLKERFRDLKVRVELLESLHEGVDFRGLRELKYVRKL